MKNILIIIVIAIAGYFGYNALNKTETTPITSQSETRTEGALTDLVDGITETLEEVKETVEDAGITAEELAEVGIETDVESNIEATVEPVVESPGSFVDYEDVDISTLDGKIVLDFYASWCPSCRKLGRDIEDSLGDIPAGVTILKVNYDRETELKQKYGVTRQHTLVQVDQSGNMISKWTGGNTLESIIAKLK